MTNEQTLDAAIQHHRSGRLAEADALYRKVLAREPEHPEALHRLGMLLAQSGKQSSALTMIDRAIAARADVAEYHNSRGVVLASLGKPGEAISAFRTAVELKPDSCEAHSTLGTALWQTREINEAVMCYRRAVELRPDAAFVHYNLGNALAGQGHRDEAINSLRRAIALKADYPEAYNNLGNLLREQRRLDEAVTAYRQALVHRPDYADALSNLGNALSLRGEMEEAIKCHRQAVQLRPRAPEILDALGLALGRNRQFLEAIEPLQMALALKPNSYDICTRLATALWESKRQSESLAMYRRAAVLGPNKPEAHANLGVAFDQCGLMEDALAAFKRAADLHSAEVARCDRRGAAAESQKKPPTTGETPTPLGGKGSHLEFLDYYIAAIGEGMPPRSSPIAYVRDLFDGYAEDFDRHLTALGYHVPTELFRLVREYLESTRGSAGDKLDILDLGCGTGLCGEAFRPMARSIVGIDLSEKMLKLAERRGVYDRLVRGDLLAGFDDATARFDLILATDVFIYVGDLSAIMARAANGLRAGGLLAFSIETHPSATEDYVLRSSRRYAQSEAYIRRLCAENGLMEVAARPAAIRQEGKDPLQGTLFLLRR